MSSAEKRAKLLSGLLAQRGEAAPSKREALAPERSSEVIPFVERKADASTAKADPILFSKGAATADTFRPAYWSYEKQAPAPTPVETPSAPRRSRINLVVVFGCLALLASTGLFVLSRMQPGGPVSMPPAAQVDLPSAPPAAVSEPAPSPAAAAVPPPAPPPAAASVAPQSEPPAPSAAAPPAPQAPPESTAVAPAAEPEPPQAAAAAPSQPAPDPQEIAALIVRGDELLGTGDVVSARLFYQRAAELGSGPAATAVGQTYDPLFLEVARVRGVRGDSQVAADWYRKAVALGDRQAEIRLRRLEAKPRD
ncbi:MAG: hypothetical protein ACM3O6_11915 [Acidobacteriota bacterium]